MVRAAIALAVALAGCGQGHDAASGDPWASSGSAGQLVGSSASPVPKPAYQAAPPNVSLVAPGAAPRRVLAYAPSRRDRHATLQFGIIPDHAPPEAQTHVTLELGWHVPDALQQRWTFAVEKASAAPVPGASAAEQATIDSIYAGFTAVRGDVVAADSQDIRELDASLVSTMPSVPWLLSAIVVPLPTEAVGVGARWRVMQTVTLDGLHGAADRTYELVELVADRAVLRVSGATKWTADAGMTVEGIDQTIAGTLTVQLSDVLPASADITLQQTLHMVLELDEASGAPTVRHHDSQIAIRVQLGP